MKTTVKYSTQQAYAIHRIDEIKHSATNKLGKAPVKDREAIVKALKKAGFIVADTYSAATYISLPETAAEKAAALVRAKKLKEINTETQKAKDSIMLGDSSEIAECLAALAKTLGV